MWRRILGRLRHADGGPVVEEHAPAESAVCVHGVPDDVECEPCTLAAIDQALAKAVAAGESVAVDNLLAARSRVTARHARLRRSTPEGWSS